jgi:acetyl esterase/lipase
MSFAPRIAAAHEAPATTVPATPTSLPSSDAHVYRALKPDPLRLHVFKPKGWKANDQRPALVYFFGGAWTRGTPEKYASWGKQATRWGMVGIVPDYRTKERFGTTPLEAVADARAAVRWVQAHARKLGIDPEKVVVCGSSSGGHLALWTAITETPPGSDPNEAPLHKPAALILTSAVSDTTSSSGVRYFGDRAKDLSAYHHLDEKMPPTLMLHGDSDKTVPYAYAVALNEKLEKSGNSSELITVPGGSHGFTSDFPEWKKKSIDAMQAFLKKEGILSEQ